MVCRAEPDVSLLITAASAAGAQCPAQHHRISGKFGLSTAREMHGLWRLSPLADNVLPICSMWQARGAPRTVWSLLHSCSSTLPRIPACLTGMTPSKPPCRSSSYLESNRTALTEADPAANLLQVWIVEYMHELVVHHDSPYMLCMLSMYSPIPSASDSSCMQSFTLHP